jgi:hypothetical protein
MLRVLVIAVILIQPIRQVVNVITVYRYLRVVPVIHVILKALARPRHFVHVILAILTHIIQLDVIVTLVIQ